MSHIAEIYRELHDEGVLMFARPMGFSCGSAAATVESGGVYGLFVDTERFDTVADETVAVAHEAGHIMTGSTHTVCSKYDLVAKHEHRANKWAIKKLLPKEELEAAICDGDRTVWELAERFDVTEDFMRLALRQYRIAG